MAEKVRKLRIIKGRGGDAYDEREAPDHHYETTGFYGCASRHPRGATALMIGAFLGSFYVVPRVAGYVLGTLHYDIGDIPFLGQFLGSGENVVPVNNASQVCGVDTEDVSREPPITHVEVPVPEPQQNPIDVAPPSQIDTAPDILDELGDEPSGWYLHIKPADGSICNGYSAKIDVFPTPPEIVPGSVSIPLSVRDTVEMPEGLLENQKSLQMLDYASDILKGRVWVFGDCEIG